MASAGSLADAAERVTFTKDVMPILQENCQTCHRPNGDSTAGMAAPMSLMNYAEARPWAKAIAKAVSAKVMPPWDATPDTHGLFINERSLTDEEIETLVRWVETGAVQGDPKDLPELKEFPDNDGWIIGRPDLEVYLEEPYWVADDVQDVQPQFTVTITEEMLPEPRWLKAVECRPGSDVVHHIFSTAAAPAYGEHPEEQFALASVAPGEDPQQYPDGFGNLLRPGTTVRFSMHYNKEPGPGTGKYDRSGLGFKFYPEGAEVRHKVTWNALGVNGVGNAVFEIPPRVSNWPIGFSGTFDQDTLLLSVHPHMHYRGKDFRYTAYYPDGSTEELIYVDRYDYNWQTIYFYREPKFIPAGTRIDAIAHFDNSETVQAEVPKLDIESPVVFAAPSEAEMMIPYVSYTHLDGDEAATQRAAWERSRAGSD
jgi:mono/diheme cytochrome c family protein